MKGAVIDEILRMAKLGWILEKIGGSFRQYFNIKNPKQHKIVVESINPLDPTDEYQVGAGADDGESQSNYNTFVPSAQYISFTDGRNQWFRFTGVIIPNGATINSAYLKVWTYYKSGDGGDVDIFADDQANPSAPSSCSDHQGRTRTTNSVAWSNIPDVDGFATSPDIKTIIQELEDSYDYSSGSAVQIFTDPQSGASGGTSARTYEYNTSYAAKLEITYTSGGQTYEINVDAVVKASVEKSLQTTYNIEKDAAVSSQAVEARQTTFNISEDAIAKVLADVSIEVISGIIEIFKDAVVQAQASISLESTFNINKDALAKASAMVSPETVFNVVKDAIVKASASPQVLRVIPINLDAVVKASATPSLQQTLGISKDAVVVTVSTPLIQSVFNISPEAIVKVLAEVDVTKERPEVIRLFIVLGLQHSALVLGLSHATIDLSLETPYTVELEVN